MISGGGTSGIIVQYMLKGKSLTIFHRFTLFHPPKSGYFDNPTTFLPNFRIEKSSKKKNLPSSQIFRGSPPPFWMVHPVGWAGESP